MALKDTCGKYLRRIFKTPVSMRDIKAGVCASGTRVANPSSRTARVIRAVYWSVIPAAYIFFLTGQTAYAADDIWSKFSSMMQDIYTKLLGISTIVAVTAAAVALLVRMISRNQRAVDEASSWLKRILVTWVILNTLGFIVAYIQPLVAGGQYNP